MNDVLPSTTANNPFDDGQHITEAVVDAVATAEGVSPLDLEPLARVIDPDALETLVESLHGGSDERSSHVEFFYSGYAVTVNADGDVSVAQDKQHD